MKKLFKKSKALIAYVAVFAVLAVSLFTGTVITASAKCNGTVSERTGEDPALTLLDATQPNSESNPYIISTANQLYSFLIAKSTYNGVAIDTTNAYFKVADGISAFYMNGGSTVAGYTDVADVKAWFENADNSPKTLWADKSTKVFKGNFDGNGAVIYGLYGQSNNVSGLFPYIGGSVTVKNVAVRNSYLKGAYGAGGIIGNAYNDGTIATTSVILENCESSNNYISSGKNDAGAGGLVGYLYSGGGSVDFTVDKCLVYGNELVSTHADAPQCTAIGGSYNDPQNKFSNSVFLGYVPFHTGGFHTKNPSNYSNCYTDKSLSTSDHKYNSTQLATVTSVAEMQGLDWANDWIADGATPALRVFHNLTLNDNGNGTHSESCDCGLMSAATAHSFVNGVCGCGHPLECVDRTYDERSGEDKVLYLLDETQPNSESNPYIIETAEQMYLFLRFISTDSAGNNIATAAGKYFKVADGVKAFYITGTKAQHDAMTTPTQVKEYFEVTNTGAQKLWTGNVFAGHFDGNGATIYGIRSDDNLAALFTKVSGGATIKNVSVRNSYLVGGSGAAGLVCKTSNDGGTVTLENCAVINCYVEAKSNGANAGAASMVGLAYGDTVKASNILVYGNEFVSPEGYSYGAVSYGWTTPIYKNIISIGISPFRSNCDTNNNSSCYYKGDVFSNVYTDQDLNTSKWVYDEAYKGTYAENQIKQLTVDDMTGAVAATNMSGLDWAKDWIATSDMPTLRSFHDTALKIKYADDEYAGHVETCSCGAGGVAVAHSYNDAYTCTVCGFVCDHQSADHYTYNETDGADHVTAGTYTKECECGYTDSGSLNDVAEHVFEDVAEVPSADCKTHGVAAHKYCSLCDKNYATDATATEPIANALTDEALQLPVAGHTPDMQDGKIVYDMSETQHAKLCAVCDEPYDYEEHTGDFVPNGAGGHVGECTVCGLELSGEAGHNFGGDNVCDDCEWTCENHTYIDGNVIEEGNCTTDRVVATKCSICGTAGANNVTTAKGHTPAKAVEENRNEATCTAEGSYDEVVYCSVATCKAEISRTEKTIAKAAHTPADAVEENRVEATCTAEGSYDEVVYCSVEGCKAEISRTEKTIAKAAHTPADAVEENRVEATCTAEGSYDEVVYCSVEGCKAEISREEKAIEATGHDLEEVAEVAATYDAEGTKAHYACETCDKLFFDEEATIEVTAQDLVIAKLVKEDKENNNTSSDNKTDDKTDDKTEGDNSNTSPATGESVAVTAIVLVIASAVIALFKKLRTA